MKAVQPANKSTVQQMKNFLLGVFATIILATAATSSAFADPYVDSWFTKYSGKYARLVETDAELTAGTSKTTWSRNSVAQTLPAYSGVQEIYSSSNYVYIRTTGLGSHLMGPWYDDATRTTLFVNIPKNQKALVRFPRTPTVPVTKTTVQGEGGYFVDGVDMFDARDAVSYINSTGQDGSPPGAGTTGDGIWNRDAYVNESVTFDPALSHQQNTGVYHYHANPIATRHLLGDHVDYNPTSKTYSESTNAPTKHSPIVAWAKDGFPVYGPYGYSISNNAASGVRRMVSGFVLRNGQNGTTNLTLRTNLPAWSARAGNRSATLAANEYGPTVSTSFPLGRYTEDNDYLGDLGQVQGIGFDLDEHNGRICVTPEFPGGTYAYFVAITSNGLPNYPYNIGRQYYGSPTGGTVQGITETVTTNFLGGADAELRMNHPVVSNNVVTLVWSATEGGTYRVESTTNFSGWNTNSTNVAAVGNTGTFSTATTNTVRLFRTARTALANYDGVTNSVSAGNGILSVSPTSANRGATFTLTINLDPTVNPPPQQAPVNSVTVGTIAGSNRVHVSQTQVTATISIPVGAATGPQTVTVVFPGPPENPTATVTYTLTNGFTIN